MGRMSAAFARFMDRMDWLPEHESKSVPTFAKVAMLFASLMVWSMAVVGTIDAARFAGSHVHTYPIGLYVDLPNGNFVGIEVPVYFDHV